MRTLRSGRELQEHQDESPNSRNGIFIAHRPPYEQRIWEFNTHHIWPDEPILPPRIGFHAVLTTRQCHRATPLFGPCVSLHHYEFLWKLAPLFLKVVLQLCSVPKHGRQYIYARCIFFYGTLGVVSAFVVPHSGRTLNKVTEAPTAKGVAVWVSHLLHKCPSQKETIHWYEILLLKVLKVVLKILIRTSVTHNECSLVYGHCVCLLAIRQTSSGRYIHYQAS